MPRKEVFWTRASKGGLSDRLPSLLLLAADANNFYVREQSIAASHAGSFNRFPGLVDFLRLSNRSRSFPAHAS